MNTETYARVVFQSPLPALSREFEYLVPDRLVAAIALGQRIRVTFAGQSKEGFVVGLSGTKEFAGKLTDVSEIISVAPVLSPEIYALLKAIAERQCCSVGELIINAVPKRSVRVEKAFPFQIPTRTANPVASRFAELVAPVCDSESGLPKFLSRVATLARDYFDSGRSVIICVPDFRDLKRVREALAHILPVQSISGVDSNEVASERYLQFLQQLTSQKMIVVGTRNAIYSPVSGDAAIIVWDDGDQSHQDQQSPYLTTREIALMRQDLFGAPLHFLSHSRSAEVQRLVRIGYLQETKHGNWRPKVAISEGSGLDAMTFKLVKRALENGPVLVQVASPGNARSLYCNDCGTRSMCRNCNGPLWMNAKGQIVCRWCGNLNMDFRCAKCNHSKLRQGGAGVTRWAEQLGKSFPGVAIREVTAEQEQHLIPNKPTIVICTAGIEPIATGGFAGAVLLDCATQLNVDSLRAPEDALRSWLNALAFMREGAEAVAVGATPEVSKALTLGLVVETVDDIVSEREVLGFPPSKRFLSATGSKEVVDSLAEALENSSLVRVLGISQAAASSTQPDFRLVASFSYASGPQVAALMKEFVAGLGAKQVRTNSKSGRSLRPLSVKFDDPRVI
ncbi:MAG: hypothetical protein RLZZ56_768 [Actinomycetota bacterium]